MREDDYFSMMHNKKRYCDTMANGFHKNRNDPKSVAETINYPLTRKRHLYYDNDLQKGLGMDCYDSGAGLHYAKFGKPHSEEPWPNPWFSIYEYFRKRIADLFALDKRPNDKELNNPNTSIQDLEKFKKYKQSSIQATIARQTIVYDVSWSKAIHPTIPVVSPETQVTVGLSFLKNIGGDDSKEGTFIHVGVGEALNAGSSIPFSWLVPTHSLGFVHGNYNKVWDYRGGFIDESGDFDGFGVAYCYWPNGAAATSFTFNAADLAAAIASEGVPNLSGAIRVDYYFLINEKKGGPTRKQQRADFLKFIKETFKGENYELDQALGDAFDWIKSNGK